MKNIKKYRLNAGLTQLQLAKKINKTEACISQYESGVHEPPRKVAMQIAEIVGCEWHEIYGDDGNGQATVS